MPDLDVLGKKALDTTHPISEADMSLKTSVAQIRHRIEKAKFDAKHVYYPDRLAQLSGTVNLEDLDYTNKGGSERNVRVETALVVVARA